MPVHADGICETKAWNEETYFAGEGEIKLTRASVTTVFSGDIVGQGEAQYLMVHLDQSAGTFTGVERIAGTLGNQAGSFVIQTSGTFAADTLRAEWSVAQGSGKGGLTGLRGSGTYLWERAQNHTTLFAFDYDFGD
jgi:Protein of unknown function (DUF3224)